MKKEDTVKLYAEKYLEGKSEEKRNEFFAKDVNRQYSAIMAWKRRESLKDEEALNVNDLLKHLRSLRRLIPLIEDLTSKDIDKLTAETDEIRKLLDSYESEKARKELERLEREQQELQQRIEMLKNRVPGTF